MTIVRLLSVCLLATVLSTAAFARTGNRTALTAPELSLNSFGAGLTALTVAGLFFRRKYSK